MAKKNCGCGQDPCVTFGAESGSDKTYGAESFDCVVCDETVYENYNDDEICNYCRNIPSQEEMKKQAMDEWYETFGEFYTTDQLDLIITERFYGYQDDEDITRELYNDINTFEQTGNEAVIVQKYRNGKPSYPSWFTKEYPNYASEEGFTPTHPPMEFGEMVDWRPLDGTPSLKRQRAEDDYVCQCGSHELRYVEYDNPEGNGFFCMNCGHSPCGINETDNEPCTCDLDEFFHRSKSYDAENSGFPAEAIQELKRNIVVFTGGAMMLSVFTAIGGFLLGRKTKEC